MHKRLAVFLVFLAGFSVIVFSQQITRVAVIDLQKVYMTYYKDSQAVRSFEEEKLRVQTEIQRLGEEIKGLQAKRLEVQAGSDSAALQSIDSQLLRKAQFLQDYIRIKKAELDDKAKALSEANAFIQTLYRTIQSMAEMDGYSLVFSSRNTDSVTSGIVWFSPMIDITDKVIQALLGNSP